MIKQSNNKRFTQAKGAVLFPIYEDNIVNSNLTESLGFDLDKTINKKHGAITKINTLGKLSFDNIYFLGLGSLEKCTEASLKDAFAKASKDIDETNLSVNLEDALCDSFTIEDISSYFTEANILANYSYKDLGKEDNTIYELISTTNIETGINNGTIVANAINNARTLANKPSNQLNPLDISEYAKNLFKDENVEIDILGNKELKKIGAGGILGVNQGSDTEAQLIVLKYNNDKDANYTALVGKGVTFDTGGYSLKPSLSMVNMKTDMHGAASVLSAFEVIVKKKLKANVYCIVPTTENMVNGMAYKPDDVLTTLSGKTVEITNTDAEGRLILADALTYTQTLGVKKIIDVATLTGACVVALGGLHSGVWANDDTFYNKLSNAASNAHEAVWRMPIDDVFTDVLKSSVVADIVNSAAPNGGGANVAASFLQEFIDTDTQWVHIDIAGTASTKAASPLTPKGATGVMVRTLSNLFE
ncbi:MAG: leucyl aminopeptidase [Erysipelothrix sp.]|nr:leucyl aminopeptidase [Erysipelothrix sp.]